MKRALVDLSSVIWTCLLAGTDTEFGIKAVDEEGKFILTKEGKHVIVNSAGFGYENAIAHLTTVMEQIKVQPRDMIFVMEGKNSKAERQAIMPTYKAGRDKLAQQYEEFNKCKEMVLKAFLNIGAQLAYQDGGVEADDVLGYLALNLDGERIIVSGDKDLAQVVGMHPDIHHIRQGQMDLNPFGDFDHSLIPTYIAIVGDPGDKIPGAKGFGKVSGEKLAMVFGDEGMRALRDLIVNKQLHKLAEDVGEMKELQKIIDDAQGVYTSYELARLRIEKINTLRRPLSWKAGMVRPRSQCEDERLRKYGGVNRLVSLENYAEAVEFLKRHLPASPYVALDIETSTPDESDEWLAKQDKEDKMVDVFGSEITGLSVTFGANMQYTVYLTHDHVPQPGITNLPLSKVRDFVGLIPRRLITWVHNSAFELPVCFNAWGKDWESDAEFHGFLPNVRDTAIASSYVDENRSKGLKNLSATLLDYEQVTYEKVTTRRYLKSAWDGVGKVLEEYLEQVPHKTGEIGKVCRGTGVFNYTDGFDHYGSPVKIKGDEIMAEFDGEEIVEYSDGPAMVRVQHKMNELPAIEVVSYGCDDTICTAALANHFVTIMEIEKTKAVFEEVETYAAYVQAKGFIDGVDFSLESMREMEADDDKDYDASWTILRDYLMKIGFEGTRFEPLLTLLPADIKRACLEITGLELKTMVRTPSKLAKLIEDFDHPSAALLSKLINENNLSEINAMMETNFTGEPRLDLASPAQVAALLYDHMGLPINIVNKATPLEKQHKPELAAAMRQFQQYQLGKAGKPDDDAMALVRKKAKSNDDAIDFALAFDTEYVDDDARAALKAFGRMKKVMTRRSLFYKNYWHAKHWKDGKVHPNINQCGTVTRRPTGSNPNVYQLPKKGEGVRFRGNILPHRRDGVICSIDFTGQELRLAAERSQDKNMLACYIGEKLKDIHSITAAGAMRLKWGPNMVKDLFGTYGADLARTEEGTYDLFRRLHKEVQDEEIHKKADDLRKDSKNVNFGAQNGAMAQKLSETLIMRLADAQLFLDAREAMFPDVAVAAERAAQHAQHHGYALTMMGARRHLAEAMLSDDKGAASRAARQSWNFEIQGSAGEMTKLAMKRWWLSGAMWKYDCRFFASIYDELVISVSHKDAVPAIKILHDVMVEPYSTMQVPILASVSVGPNFADQTECGDWFIEERVRKALNDIFHVKEAA